MKARTALLLIAALLLPTAAEPHAVLVKSSPTRRAVLALPPARVELVFNERLERAYSSVSVWTAANVRVDNGQVVVGPDDPRRLSVGLAPLAAGRYVVRYRVLSVDGHIVEGEVPFEVRLRP